MSDDLKPHRSHHHHHGKSEDDMQKRNVAAIKGISQTVAKNLKAKDLARQRSESLRQITSSPSQTGRKSEAKGSLRRGTISTSGQHIDRHSKGSVRLSVASKSVLNSISVILDLEEYEFPEEEEMDPQKIDAKLDVTALDRYNEDIRRIRKLAIEECRTLPQKGDPDERVLNKIKLTVRFLCRTTYYGTHKAIKLAEGSVILIVWLLNRRNIKTAVKVHILQSLAEMMWTSTELKFALFSCRGVKLIVKLLVNGLKQRSDQAKWACYTLSMSCISCPEVIAAVLEIDRIDEVVGEVAFHAYWSNWPANFGSILQGILFGPHSVIPVEDAFDFV